MLTERFTHAIAYARRAHATQVRKGSSIPYLYHLLGVASLVIEFGGDEDQAIAGLLHDVIEDGGEAHRALVRAAFGDGVARIVEDCTDGSAEGKARYVDADARRSDWVRRKLTYLAHLQRADARTLLVSGCDKLHNARAVVQDLENPTVGVAVFERFTGGRDGTLGYYEALSRIFVVSGVPMARVIDATVARMHELAGGSPRLPLRSETQEAAWIGGAGRKAFNLVELARLEVDDSVHPAAFFDGETQTNVTSWADLDRKFVAWLIHAGHLTRSHLPIHNHARGGKYFIHSTREHGDRQLEGEWSEVEGLFVDTKYNARAHVRNLLSAFEQLGLNIPEFRLIVRM